MNVQVLSQKERKKSLSGKKNKTKKTNKNILAPPDEYDIKNTELNIGDNSELISLLQNLLPQAQLQNSGKRKKKVESEKMDEKEQVSENRLKRNQLLLGINVVIKGVKNGTAACVIFSDNITPRLMTSHLKLLCHVKGIPYLHIPKFKELTRQTLGFPCMVVGVKKDSVDFAPIIELICTRMKHSKYGLRHHFDCSEIFNARTEPVIREENIRHENENENEREKTEDISCTSDAKKGQKPFVYLQRIGANDKRAFDPDSEGEAFTGTSKNEDFITLAANNEDPGGGKKYNRIGGETSGEQRIKNKRKPQSNSDIENGTEISVEYSAAKVVKLAGNPVRAREKRLKYKD